MNHIGSISNSRAVHEPFIHARRYTTPVSGYSQHVEELQSSAVTLNGLLWWRKLACMAYENSPTVSQNDLDKNEFSQSIVQSQKNNALIQLLRSWREGDEQEQRKTWEYLKQALDEDRLSERKLFP